MIYSLNRPRIARKIIAHLKTMKRRSGTGHKKITGDFMCRYRTRGGDKCAIGALMPDWIYSASMENTSIADLMDLFHDEPTWPEFEVFLAETYGNGGPLTTQDVIFLGALQVIHDSAESWNSKGITSFALYSAKRLAGMV